MIWFNSISELQYYNPTPNGECYCESLLQPNDMQLQGLLFNGANPYTVTLYVYSADGLTQYADATTYFDIYTAKATNGQDYFNARLKSFHPTMCLYKCFIIRAIVVSGGLTIFDKWTERWCQNDCCDTVSGVTYAQEGLAVIPSDGVTPVRTNQPLLTSCGDPVIRIISRFECIDEFTGEIYGDPIQVFSGAAEWNFTKITTTTGRIVPRPRDITREISYNCRLQRVESRPTYLLEAYEMFPAWKMLEIEGQLHANRLWVDDYINQKEYLFTGGTPFAKVEGALSCTELFKLETPLYECTQRQIFGCTTLCEATNNGYLIIPASYNDGGFYDENGTLIATVLDGTEVSPYAVGLVQWLASQDGITSVTVIDITGYTCEDYTYAIVQVQGNGYIPTFIYIDSPTSVNRIYTNITNDADALCDYIGETPCAKPVLWNIAVTDMVCATPVIGDIVVETITPTDLLVTDYGSDWVQSTSSGALYNTEVSLSIETTNTSIIAGIGEDFVLTAVTIASIQAEGRPTTTVVLTSDNSTLTGDTIVAIFPTGEIQVSGTFTITVTDELTLDFDNLTYSI